METARRHELLAQTSLGRAVLIHEASHLRPDGMAVMAEEETGTLVPAGHWIAITPGPDGRYTNSRSRHSGGAQVSTSADDPHAIVQHLLGHAMDHPAFRAHLYKVAIDRPELREVLNQYQIDPKTGAITPGPGASSHTLVEHLTGYAAKHQAFQAALAKVAQPRPAFREALNRFGIKGCTLIARE